MRILSRFNDYYDVVMKSGMDKDTVYVREQKTVDLDRKFNLDYFYTSINGPTMVFLHFLGYCGQVFKAMEVITPTSRHIFYDYDQFKEFTLKYKICSEWDFGKARWWPGKFNKFIDHDTNAMKELFHTYQVPLFLISTRRHGQKPHAILLNPHLKGMEFHKIKDTYTAYQDIFQFVAGVLNQNENDMVKISDKDKIHKHGFDKWSFRKMPSQKKKK